MSTIYCFIIFFWYWLCPIAQTQYAAQKATIASASAVADSSRRLVVASGKKARGNIFIAVSPGTGHAIHFALPTNYHTLSTINLHFRPFGHDTVAKGQIRVRIASVAANGGPANDDLLADHLILTEQILQNAAKAFALVLPGEHIKIPSNGFYVVLEGLGESPDEYTAKLIITRTFNGTVYYEIRRSSQPNSSARLVRQLSVPTMISASNPPPRLNYWSHGGTIVNWQVDSRSKQIPLVEVGFD